jgi:hypothetical protein
VAVDRSAESQVGFDGLELIGAESLDQVGTDLQTAALRRHGDVDDRDAVRVSSDSEHAYEITVIFESTEPQAYRMRDVRRPSLQELSGNRLGQLADVYARERLAQPASFQAREGCRLGFHGADLRFALDFNCDTAYLSI